MADWNVRNKELSEDDICISTKDVLPTSVQYEMEDKDEYYRSLNHK